MWRSSYSAHRWTPYCPPSQNQGQACAWKLKLKLKLSVVQGYKCLKYESDDFVELTLLKDYNSNDENDDNDDEDDVVDDTTFKKTVIIMKNKEQ